MKKILCLCLCLLSITVCLTGCGEKSDDTVSKAESEINSTVSDTVRAFTGTVTYTWDEISGDYKKLETEAEDEVNKAEKFTKDDINQLVSEIESGLAKLSEGVTAENRETADKVYKDAHKLEVLAKKGETDAAKEFKELGKNAKAVIKQYYGVAEDDYDTLTGAVSTGIKKIGNFTDDVWTAFTDLFK